MRITIKFRNRGYVYVGIPSPTGKIAHIIDRRYRGYRIVLKCRSISTWNEFKDCYC